MQASLAYPSYFSEFLTAQEMVMPRSAVKQSWVGLLPDWVSLLWQYELKNAAPPYLSRDSSPDT